MARQARFTYEAAIEFLSSRPETHGRKPLSELKPAEVMRKARTAERLEREGKGYSNKEARGHAGNVSGRAAPITHIDPKHPPARKPGWKYQQDQFVVGKKERPLSNQDIRREMKKRDDYNRKRSGKRPKDYTPREDVTLYVYGLLKKYTQGQNGEPVEKTLSVATTRASVEAALSRYGNTADAMNYLFGYDVPTLPEGPSEGWLEVWSVSVVSGPYEHMEQEE